MIPDISMYQAPSRAEKTAQSLRNIGHKLAMTPIIGSLIGMLVAPLLSAAATAIDTFDGITNKGIGEGSKRLISGTVDTAANAIANSTFFMPVNWVFALATGDSAPELLRKGTRAVLDEVIASEPLGSNPRTIGAVPAAIGYAQGLPQQMMMANSQRTPFGEQVPATYWRDGIANQRGMDPATTRAAWESQNRDEYRALRAAAAEQSQAPLGVS